MYIHNLSPELWGAGFFSIRYYSLAYILGMLAVYLVFWYAIKKKHIALSYKQLDSLLLYLFVGLVIGGRIGYFLLYNPVIFVADPLRILAVWNGGMAFHGGLLGGILAVIVFAKRNNIRIHQLSDILVIPISFTLIFGRLANWINGELVGTPTKVPWCVIFPNTDNICRHPSQLYEAAKNVLLFGATSYTYWRHSLGKLKEGVPTYTFIAGYGILRFIVTFWRADPDFLWIFSRGQTYSLVMAIVGIAMLIYLQRNKNV